jgi:hypothetical protein
MEAAAGGWRLGGLCRSTKCGDIFALFICWEGESEGIKMERKPSKISRAYKGLFSIFSRVSFH